MGETRVDLLHLLEDLADAYGGELEETVLPTWELQRIRDTVVAGAWPGSTASVIDSL